MPDQDQWSVVSQTPNAAPPPAAPISADAVASDEAPISKAPPDAAAKIATDVNPGVKSQDPWAVVSKAPTSPINTLAQHVAPEQSTFSKFIAGPNTMLGTPVPEAAKTEVSGLSDILHGNIGKGAGEIWAAEAPHVIPGSPLEKLIQRVNPNFKGEGTGPTSEKATSKPPFDAAQFIDMKEHPVYKALVESAQSFLSPETIAMMAATGGAGMVDSPAALGMASNLISAGFSGLSAAQAYKNFNQFKEAYDSGDATKALYFMTHMVTSGAMSALTAQHAATGEGPTENAWTKAGAKADIAVGQGIKKAVGAVGDLAEKAKDLIPNKKAGILPAEHLAQAADNIYSAIKPGKSAVADDFRGTLEEAMPQLSVIANKNPNVSNPVEAATAIEQHRLGIEGQLKQKAMDMRGLPEARMDGIEEQVQNAIKAGWTKAERKFTPDEMERAEANVMKMYGLETGKMEKDPDTGEMTLRVNRVAPTPDLYGTENIRQRFADDTRAAFNAGPGNVPSAEVYAKQIANQVNRAAIDQKFEDLGVDGVKEWRKQESALISVRDALQDAAKRSEDAGKWNVWDSMFKRKGWGAMPAVVGAVVGGAPGAIVGELAHLGVDWWRDQKTNPNILMQKGWGALHEAGKSAEAAIPGKVTPTVGQPPMRAATAEDTGFGDVENPNKGAAAVTPAPETDWKPEAGTKFYHGTKANVSDVSQLDASSFSKPTSLLGLGTYLTDNPEVASGYASTTKGTGAGRVLGAKIPEGRYLDAEASVSPEIRETFQKAAPSDSEKLEGNTARELFNSLRNSYADAGWSTDEATGPLQDLTIELRKQGYTGLRYEGGKTKLGQKYGAHNVAVVFPDYEGNPVKIEPDIPSRKMALIAPEDIYYHGTNSADVIRKSGFSAAGSGSSFLGDNYADGVYLSKSKEPYQEGGQLEDVKDVLPVKINAKNLVKVDGFSGIQDLYKKYGISEMDEKASSKLTKSLKADGYEGIDSGDEVVVFDPKKVNTAPKITHMGGKEGANEVKLNIGGEDKGALYFTHEGDKASINSSWLDKTERGKGYGQQLILEAANKAKNQGARFFTSDITGDTSPSATRAWRALEEKGYPITNESGIYHLDLSKPIEKSITVGQPRMTTVDPYRDMIPGAEKEFSKPNVVEEPKEGETWYHGRRGKISWDEDRPAWFTRDRKGAEWFSQDRGKQEDIPNIGEFNLDIKKPAHLRDLIQTAKELGITGEDVSKYSQYEGDNIPDLLYVPKIRKALADRGFDGFVGHDTLENHDIEVAIPLRNDQIDSVKSAVVGQPQLKPLEVPSNRLPEGHTTQSTIHHEFGHILEAQDRGMTPVDIRSHLHPESESSTAQAHLDWSEFGLNEKGELTADKVAPVFVEKFLPMYAAGGVINDLIDGIPITENKGLSGDAKGIKLGLEYLGFTPEQMTDILTKTVKGMKDRLTGDPALDIIKKYAANREEGLPDTHHASAARVQEFLNEVREARRGTKYEQAAPTGVGGGSKEGSSEVVRQPELRGAGAGAKGNLREGNGEGVRKGLNIPTAIGLAGAAGLGALAGGAGSKKEEAPKSTVTNPWEVTAQSGAKTLAKPPVDIPKTIDTAAENFDIPKDILQAQARRESLLNPNAVSKKGAKGVMQLMDPTAAELGVTDPFDPEQNIPAGAEHLSNLYKHFKSWDKALAAYDWGGKRVDDAVAAHGKEWLKHVPKETRDYVHAILAEQDKK